MGSAGDGEREPSGVVDAPEHIVCVDCGGTCGLLTRPEVDEEGNPLPFAAGDVVAYRCADCNDRWDIELA